MTQTIAARLDLEEGVRELGLWVAESDANFIWLHLPEDCDEPALVVGPARARRARARRGVAGARAARCGSRSGPAAENERFVGALGEALRGAPL